MYKVTARRWAKGWELHIEGVGVTQSRTLAKAEAMVRDYLEVDGAADANTAQVAIVPEVEGVTDRVQAIRVEQERVAREQEEVARKWRGLAGELTGAGLSLQDTAAVLGVTKARAQQLVS